VDTVGCSEHVRTVTGKLFEFMQDGHGLTAERYPMVFAHFHAAGGNAPKAPFDGYLVPATKTNLTGSYHRQYQQLQPELNTGVALVTVYGIQKFRHHAEWQAALVGRWWQGFHGMNDTRCRVVLDYPLSNGKGEDLLNVGTHL